MRALVLGGSVFVGKRLVRALQAAGYDDVTVLNRGKTPTQLPAGVEHLPADRTDMGAMRAALGDREWEVVYDVSGFVMAAGGSDIASLIELLDGRVGSYVFCSSIMAYDQSWAGIFPWREDQPSNPDGSATYGGFKAFAERLMMERYAATGFPASVVRPAAIYGPENNIYDMETPMFLRLAQSRPILVPHGGLVAGSYGHVDDLCELMVAMAELPAARGEIFNVTADGVSSMRYVTTLAEIVGVEPDIRLVPDDLLPSISTPVFGHLFGVRHHAIASIEKAAAVLGFRPRFDFTTGHRATYEWFREQGWDESTDGLRDPVWGASWDFEAEAELAGRLR
jgi:nucleoside-diphosphate-sugar epimerase